MIALLRALFGGRGAQLTAHEARARMQRGAVLVDVREPAEFARGHAPGARLLPLSHIRAGVAGALETLDLPDAPHELLLICHSGMRSRIAQAALAGHPRVRCVNVAGGMQAWAAAGLPTTPPQG
ncbi:rhodanese-like domain-containing protein [Stenotrophomonas acidaminiphila]|uniref:rhodanese-like domain-containing protein n=1 Tax=Stenotrophomonas acidaminiphila TaxID=128780 RepID=UPI0028B1C50A|nr:rhodanese-like domain-containing protein [Stenotrophomonas acidaminiphila]